MHLGPTAYTTIGWWQNTADISTTGPTESIDTSGRAGNFILSQFEFEGHEGNWYPSDGS